MAGSRLQDEVQGGKMEREGVDKGSKSVREKEAYLSVKDMAILLGVDPSTVFQLVGEGSLSHLVEKDGHRLFLRAEVDRFVERAS